MDFLIIFKNLVKIPKIREEKREHTGNRET